MRASDAHNAIDAVWRIESARLIAALTRLTGDVGTAEDLLGQFPNQTREFVRLGLLAKTQDNFVLTRAGKAVADSVAEAFV